MIWIIVVLLFLLVLLIRFSNKSEKQSQNDQYRDRDYQNLIDEKEEKRKLAFDQLSKVRNEFDAQFRDGVSFEFNIVGIFYRSYEAQEIAKYLNSGEKVVLLHDKKNSNSPHAIKVIAEKSHIGFVPDKLAEEMLPYLQKYYYKAFVLLSFTEFNSLKFDYVTEVTIKSYFFEK